MASSTEVMAFSHDVVTLQLPISAAACTRPGCCAQMVSAIQPPIE